MGYDSFAGGLSMMPRGVGCMIGLFIHEKLAQIMNAKKITFIGIAVLCLASWSLGFINLEISSSSVVIPNIMYGLGMSLGMMPLITFSCKSISASQMSNASGLQNFIKTVGGAVGTSLVANFISRFSQTHRHLLISSLTESNHVFVERLQIYTVQFAQSYDTTTANAMAHAVIYKQLITQANLRAYIDSFRIFAIAGLVMLILVFVLRPHEKTRKNKTL